jgi:hypothetical protein
MVYISGNYSTCVRIESQELSTGTPFQDNTAIYIADFVHWCELLV